MPHNYYFRFEGISADAIKFIEKVSCAFMASTFEEVAGVKTTRGLIQFKKGVPAFVGKFKTTCEEWRMLSTSHNPWFYLSSMLRSGLPIAIRGDPICLGFGEAGRYSPPLWRLAKHAMWSPDHPGFKEDYAALSLWSKCTVDDLVDEMRECAEDYHKACGKYMFPRFVPPKRSLASEPTMKLF